MAMEDLIKVHASTTEYWVFTKRFPENNQGITVCSWNRQFKVVIHAGARVAVLHHALSDSHREVGGALIGRICCDTERNIIFFEITNAIRGQFTRGSSVELTFTSDTWSQIVREAENRFPGQEIVGWYHTHPGHGVFLSGDDLFIQDHFFDGLRVALVIDHFCNTGAFFLGTQRTGGPHQSTEFVLTDRPGRVVKPLDKARHARHQERGTESGHDQSLKITAEELPREENCGVQMTEDPQEGADSSSDEAALHSEAEVDNTVKRRISEEEKDPGRHIDYLA